MSAKGRLAFDAFAAIVIVAVVVAAVPGTAEKLIVAGLLILLLPGVGQGLFRLLSRPFSSSHRPLERRGQVAEATVLDVRDTGWSVNGNPRISLRLEVRPGGDPPFQAEIQTIVSRLLVVELRPGALVQVRYDPQDRRRLELLPRTAVPN